MPSTQTSVSTIVPFNTPYHRSNRTIAHRHARDHLCHPRPTVLTGCAPPEWPLVGDVHAALHGFAHTGTRDGWPVPSWEIGSKKALGLGHGLFLA